MNEKWVKKANSEQPLCKIYMVNFLNFKTLFSFNLPDHKTNEKEKNIRNLSIWELKYSPRAENLETMINNLKKL